MAFVFDRWLLAFGFKALIGWLLFGSLCVFGIVGSATKALCWWFAIALEQRMFFNAAHEFPEWVWWGVKIVDGRHDIKW